MRMRRRMILQQTVAQVRAVFRRSDDGKNSPLRPTRNERHLERTATARADGTAAAARCRAGTVLAEPRADRVPSHLGNDAVRRVRAVGLRHDCARGERHDGFSDGLHRAVRLHAGGDDLSRRARDAAARDARAVRGADGCDALRPGRAHGRNAGRAKCRRPPRIRRAHPEIFWRPHLRLPADQVRGQGRRHALARASRASGSAGARGEGRDEPRQLSRHAI